jgi:outer membrane receptor protein involved in Fe transport
MKAARSHGLARGRRSAAQRIAFATAISAIGLLIAPSAWAQSSRIFRLPREPVERAMLRFGLQAGVSVGGLPTAGCTGESRPVIGMMRPAEALRRLLPTGCSFTTMDKNAFVIVGETRSPPAPAPPAAVIDVQELVVTAEKRPEPLLASPFPVSAFSGREVERLGAKDFSELASQMAGVAETNLGPGRDKIFIRGVSDGAFTGRTQSTVGLYLDDVPITYNAPDPALRLVDIERVEVLRGPQGTLYGSGSMGGIVRIVTAKPDPKAFSADATIEGMFNDRQDSSSGVTGMMNVPFAGGRGAVRAVAYRDDLTGYLDNLGLGKRDVNHGRRAGGRIAGLMDLPANWRLQGAAGWQSIYTSDSQYTTGDRNRSTFLREPHDNDFGHLGFTLSHTGSAADLRISGGYIEHDTRTRYDATDAFQLGIQGPTALDETSRAELWVGEAVLTSAGPSERLRWLIGTFGSYSEEHQAVDLAPFGDRALAKPLYTRRDRLDEAAAFGEASYDLTSRLSVTLGGRIFATRVGGLSSGFGLAASQMQGLRAHLTDKGFTPKLRVSYAFAPDVVAYAQYQEGYRAGGFNIPGSTNGTAGAPDAPLFQPDRLTSFEIGGELPLFDRTLRNAAPVVELAKGVCGDRLAKPRKPSASFFPGTGIFPSLLAHGQRRRLNPASGLRR